jgi:hypothetical protein
MLTRCAAPHSGLEVPVESCLVRLSARWVSRFTPLLVACFLGTSIVLSFDYSGQRVNAVKACEAIDPSLSQSGLLFNPEGYRSYYVRSKCFQEAAVLFRDPALCDQVKRRWSLTSSSWGYTAARCRQLVAEGTAADRAELEGLKNAYAAGGIKLRDFRIERNGNGRDVDIIPIFTGTFGHGYTLTFEILSGPSTPALIHMLGYYVDQTANLRIYIPQADIKKHFPEFALNRSYTVRATVTLDVGYGGQAGYWSPSFIEGVFPARERTQSITRQSTF